jgi:hypothetical protein
VALARKHLTLARLRADDKRQAKAAARDLRTAIKADVAQLYANGAVPTSQQMADFDASVAGAVDARALRLSNKAPGSALCRSRLLSTTPWFAVPFTAESLSRAP